MLSAGGIYPGPHRYLLLAFMRGFKTWLVSGASVKEKGTPEGWTNIEHFLLQSLRNMGWNKTHISPVAGTEEGMENTAGSGKALQQAGCGCVCLCSHWAGVGPMQRWELRPWAGALQELMQESRKVWQLRAKSSMRGGLEKNPAIESGRCWESLPLPGFWAKKLKAFCEKVKSQAYALRGSGDWMCIAHEL